MQKNNKKSFIYPYESNKIPFNRRFFLSKRENFNGTRSATHPQFY